MYLVSSSPSFLEPEDTHTTLCRFRGSCVVSRELNLDLTVFLRPFHSREIVDSLLPPSSFQSLSLILPTMTASSHNRHRRLFVQSIEQTRSQRGIHFTPTIIPVVTQRHFRITFCVSFVDCLRDCERNWKLDRLPTYPLRIPISF